MVKCKKCSIPLDIGTYKKITCPRCMSKFKVSEKNGKVVLKLLREKKKDIAEEAFSSQEPVSDFTLAPAPSATSKETLKESDISLFFKAVQFEDIKNIKFLLKLHPSLISAADKRGQSGLHIAARIGREEVAKLFLSRKAHIDAKDKDGYTPLHRAAKKGWRNIVRLFLAKGASVNYRDNCGNTPLHLSVSAGREKVVKLLIKKADISAKNDDGETPLHKAILKGDKEIERFLISNGADINAKDNDGMTPMDYRN